MNKKVYSNYLDFIYTINTEEEEFTLDFYLRNQTLYAESNIEIQNEEDFSNVFSKQLEFIYYVYPKLMNVGDLINKNERGWDIISFKFGFLIIYIFF